MRLGFVTFLCALLLFVPYVRAEENSHGNVQTQSAGVTEEGVQPDMAHGDVAHDAGHHGEESSSGLPQFNPKYFPSQIFWLAVAFAAMFFFFRAKTLPDISSTLDARKAHIKSNLDEADALQEKADLIRSAYEKNLAKAQSDAVQAAADVETAMKAKAAKEYEAFQKRAEKEMSDLEVRMNIVKSKAMDDMNDIAAEVAADAVEKIIGVKTDKSKAKSIVESLSDKAKAA